MQRTSIWFDSPLLKPAANIASQIKQEHEPQSEDQGYFSRLEHQPQASAYKYSHHNNPQSPWSLLIHPNNQGKNAHLSISGMFPSRIYEEEEIIDEKLLYSQEDDQFPVTPPIKREEECRSVLEGREINTTGRRTQYEQLEKKARTKEKGLRVLSQKAYEVVQKLKNATYKEVATKLFQGLSEQEQDGENHDEQNIKRRVYDALNVLIALGVLKKDRKRVVSEKRVDDRVSYAENTEEVDRLQQMITQKHKILTSKRKELQGVEEKCQSIARLMKRNKHNKKSKGQVIPFPFIGVIIEHPEESQFSHKYEQILIKSETPLQPFGDIDALKWLQQSTAPHFLKQEES